MIGRIGTALALASVAALVLVGCTPEEPVETTPPARSSETPPQPTPISDEQLRLEALDVAREFVALVDEGFSAGELPVDRMASIASDEAIMEVQSDLDAFRSEGLQLDGESALDSPTLGGRDAADEFSGVARLLVCLDTSNVTTTDNNGVEIDGGVARQPRVFVVAYNPDGVTITDVGPPQDELEFPGCGS